MPSAPPHPPDEREPDGVGTAPGVTGARRRCAWPRTELDIQYHDAEWGVPVHEDRVLFELLTLEGAQAGLSWSTILKKRPHYQRAFAGFDPAAVARFSSARIERLLENAGLVRHRGKLESTVSNARAVLAIQREFGRFDRYLWSFVGGAPRLNRWESLGEIPTRTTESDALSADLKRRGFRFVGSTICYAFMQAIGMVNDHTTDCFRHAELKPSRTSGATTDVQAHRGDVA